MFLARTRGQVARLPTCEDRGVTPDRVEPLTYYERAYSIGEDETKRFYAEWAAPYDEEVVGGCGTGLRRRAPTEP